ncbi:HlyD family efflux transporter periplasmic adaptor subunit [Halomonas sp. 328]|uniref:HlyD family efflux transporter periplasmic adaptor subunit n=1 Tax=Halomonas sp. 328 TaxID=2776704 RepID=UPI0018A70C78|nr:HlyD family efflux transporter periplasmic adaptor subunit [Halomonas sp. 328]MBF8224461.1 HlyD family efflux transporter periplasmic adaptor subunit [Halomonas sp. 328]
MNQRQIGFPGDDAGKSEIEGRSVVIADGLEGVEEGRYPLWMIIWLSVGLGVFLAWAYFFEIDQYVRAQGEVIPGGRTQEVQVSDGGALAEILVHEGDLVLEGQELAILRSERPRAAYEEGRHQLAALQASVQRLHAEAHGIPLQFGEELDAYPRLLDAESNLYEQQRQALDDQLMVLRDSLEIASEELAMQQSLLSGGDTSRLEVSRAQQQVIELQGRIQDAIHQYRGRAAQELSRLESELAVQRYRLVERADVLDQTVVRSPVRGYVNLVTVNTLGGVLRPGDKLMEITPLDDEVLVEVRVNPVDVGDLEVGLPVSVKVDTFDYTMFGAISGELVYLSSNTLQERGEGGRQYSYYLGRVRLDDVAQDSRLRNDMLQPGMTVSVDIKTSRRTVIEYIAKPVMRAFSGALSER